MVQVYNFHSNKNYNLYRRLSLTIRHWSHLHPLFDEENPTIAITLSIFPSPSLFLSISISFSFHLSLFPSLSLYPCPSLFPSLSIPVPLYISLSHSLSLSLYHPPTLYPSLHLLLFTPVESHANTPDLHSLQLTWTIESLHSPPSLWKVFTL